MAGWSGRAIVVFTCAGVAFACGSSSSTSGFDAGPGTTGSGGGSGGGGGDDGPFGGGDGGGGSGGGIFGDGSRSDTGTIAAGDPVTCAQAEASHSYIGCDYWPTVLDNAVWSIFDYAVIVANAGASTADVTVTGPGAVNQTATVDPGGLTKIYLPWVASLKGGDSDNCGTPPDETGSVLAKGAAYHLVASVPVTVYQFNALEYKGAGGPAGKSWAQCPGDTRCRDRNSSNNGGTLGCYSFSNDASLLLPTTAMTGNYRVVGYEDAEGLGAYAAITATQDDTAVTVKASATAHIVAGTGIADTPPGGRLTLTMNAGDVAELFGDGSSAADDLSGSVVSATNPVEVFTGSPCTSIPDSIMNTCDHLEEVNFPAETLGKDYVVTVPTGPYGTPIGHLVRIYGDFDGTMLSYEPAAPAGCPATLDAGQVVECGIVTSDFEVKGSQPFSVGSFMESGTIVDPKNGEGDPSESFSTAVEQYRTKYVFLAPEDYDFNFADIAAPTGAVLSLDGAAVTATATPLGGTGYEVFRVALGAGQGGAHVLTATKAVGLQVLGYGSYTSYQYPGGLDLQQIAPPPAQVN